MHYKNGREAKELDNVVYKPELRDAKAGVVYDLRPTAKTCNATLVYPSFAGNKTEIVNLSDCLHADCAFQAYVNMENLKKQSENVGELKPQT